MPLLKETAFDILGLPTFAAVDEIVLRYKSLAIAWFPEGHPNPELAIQEFSNITEAAVILLYPQKRHSRNLKLQEMYGFFHYIFFGDKGTFEESDSEESESSIPFEVAESILEAEEMKAENNAYELIDEEEREKQKSEKRKAKKKRRKERKKNEKISSQTLQVGVPIQKKTRQRVRDTKVSESEEELDSASAFVSVVAKKYKKPQDSELKNKAETSKKSSFELPKEIDTSSSFVSVMSKKQKKLLQQNLDAKNTVEASEQTDPELSVEESVVQSRQYALRGNELASTGYYTEAIELFTESIRLDPTDHRFYGNRSYCYDRLGQYDRALKDAEKSIVLSPVWPKGYFRKGRALLGLKQYSLAEQYFIEVLKRDDNCDDAICELRKARVLQIMERGYSKEIAEAALSQYSTVSEALTSLLFHGISRMQVKDDLDEFVAEVEAPPVVKSMVIEPSVSAKAPVIVVTQKKTKPEQPYDIKMDPNNPEGHNSLWIGNVQTDVTEKKLQTMFGKYGELLSIKVMPEKFCAFVNFKNKSCPGKAMKAYQGLELGGAKLLIRFPNLPGETLPTKKKSVMCKKK